jgi:hypothetical protein
MKLLANILAEIRIVATFLWKQLFVRLMLLLFASLTLALLLVVAGNINETIHPFFYNLAAAGAEGLSLGFLSRLLLRNRSFGLQLAFALVALLTGLFYMGWVSWGFIGIAPLPFPRSQPDRLGLVLVSTGLVGLVLALLAWRTSLNKRPAKRPARESASRPHPAEEPIPILVSPVPPPPPPSRNWFVRLRNRLPAVHWPRIRTTDIRLVGTEEHRCPYCLQPVARRDPRGVTICPDCGTWHHEDCWSITGMCQIPHEHPV